MSFLEKRNSVLNTRNFILRGMCAIYLIAFLSFYHQSEGLFGDNGILPARIHVSHTAKLTALQKRPSMLHFAYYLGIDTASMVDFLAIAGVLISFGGFVSQGFCLTSTFAALWALYYSLTQVTQAFGNQADALLLEAGALCLLLAPINDTRRETPTDRIGLLMMRWLLFRFMFVSGGVKLATACPFWWSLTGLERHFETLPLPTPLSWYAFHLPPHYNQLGMVFTNLSELLVPWLFLSPMLTMRTVAFYWHMFLQFHIIVTGNYGFLNFLIVILLFALLDDTHFLKRRDSGAKERLTLLLKIAIVGAIAYAGCHLYGIGFRNGQFTFKLKFKKADYEHFFASALKISPLLPLIGVIVTFMNEMMSHPSIRRASSLLGKFVTILTTSFFLVCCIGLIGMSTVPHRGAHRDANISHTEIGHMYGKFRHLGLVSEYGRHLREMRAARLEVVLEHADHIEGPWQEYEFQYKPGNVNFSLPMAGPYLPRLDFQMYDVAAKTYDKVPWLPALALRLLSNEASVMNLLSGRSHLRQSPKFVRGVLYEYHYTSWAERNNLAYWTRRRVREFLPPLALDHAPLQEQLKALKIPLQYKIPPVTNAPLKNALMFVRRQAMLLEGSFFVFSFLALGFAIIATNRRN
ncbi:lipase maturation factor 2-like [Phlebotomus argentipes]|uniref:lipase maturation factor 2-like n=1 Tax=Phlebotomus argentipes TaxID=94469 RepID=UPI0028929C0B|nr:lipase maturation factor 2-like [Phlebotomus argentipes]